MSTEELYDLFRLYPEISTDSRNIPRNGLFFALKGARFDGNLFALQALEQGAAYAVVDDPALASHERCVLVPDVLKALQNLAWHHRQQISIPVLGITGSNGKTTTKELIYSVISRKYRTLATSGNLNNHIGVPLTLLRIGADTEFAVIEMGANHPGEIELLCSIALPTHGLITNVSKAHLEGFGGLEGVIKTKKELYDSLAIHQGTAFLNADNPLLLSMAAELPHLVRYGSAETVDVRGALLESYPRLRFSWQVRGKSELHTVDSALSGKYNFENLLAAVCVGSYFGVSPDDIAAGIASYVPSNNRSQEVQHGSNRLLLDAYNANPASMSAALENFASRPEKDKLAVLGDMFELGSYSEEEHAAILKLAAKLGIPRVFLIGPEFGRHRASFPSFRFFDSTEEAGQYLKNEAPENSLVLLKGSRGMQLERLLPYLEA